ncbi:hypothetical protein EJK54_0203 [Moraxella catarrhalis]|uniref:Uncharacterized protein n=1 Tax=Moraxella catarrhalis TaxID=480 RepID=A0A3Q9GFL2_MORCA|nr:hypothetical protein EJK53_0587 [Moraxella catarrhalis]AZQ96190.1 hypothetical protein EJK48_0590 [Moraxella catarrhalis]RUO13438.1 hypothetical protein EJK54_0203 [Moraxella catarrhalis]RUO14647.1 hypothetical protein EJK49_1792 [Moraxella catarrhalis]
MLSIHHNLGCWLIDSQSIYLRDTKMPYFTNDMKHIVLDNCNLP